MSNQIQVTVVIDDKGSLQQVTQKATKAATGVTKLGNAASTADRNLKGAAKASSNSTKNFSKMAQGISGGLVPAYATLAANIFAISAAFNALRKAAGFEQLKQGLEVVGLTAGRSLDNITNKLKEVTGAAVSTKEAMTNVALGVSAGFSEEQILGLTKVAKGASLALGRDLTDAMSRLTRGAAKLEPEILDELGIMVRLDDAVESYARTLGKGKNELSQFERRMAFTNAIIEQGEKKFRAVADAVDVNPYDRLAASFENIATEGLTLVNNVLIPVVDYLSKAPMALIGVLGIFASTIIKAVVPAIGEVAIQQQKIAAFASKQIRQNVEDTAKKVREIGSKLPSFDIAPKGAKKFEAAMRAGKAEAKDLKKVLRSLEASERLRFARLEAERAKQNGWAPKILKQKQDELDLIIAQRKAVQALADAESRRNKNVVLTGKGERLKRQANVSKLTAAGLGAMAGAGPIAQFGIAGKTLKRTIKQISLAEGGLSKLATGFRVAGAGARLFGAALLNAIPVLGQVLFIGTMLWDVLGGLFVRKKTALQEAIEESSNLTEEYDAVIQQLGKTLNNVGNTGLSAFEASLESLSGMLRTAADQASSVITEVEKITIESQARIAAQFSGEAGFTGGLDDPLAVSTIGTSFAKMGQEPPIDKLISDEAILEARNAMSSIASTTANSIKIMAAMSNTQLTPRMAELTKEFETLSEKMKTASREDLKQGAVDMAKLSYEVTQLTQALAAADGYLSKTKDLFKDIDETTGPFASHIKIVEGILKDVGENANLEEVRQKYLEILKAFGVTDFPGLKALLTDFSSLNKKVNEADRELKKSITKTKTLLAEGTITEIAAIKRTIAAKEKKLETERIYSQNILLSANQAQKALDKVATSELDLANEKKRLRDAELAKTKEIAREAEKAERDKQKAIRKTLQLENERLAALKKSNELADRKSQIGISRQISPVYREYLTEQAELESLSREKLLIEEQIKSKAEELAIWKQQVDIDKIANTNSELNNLEAELALADQKLIAKKEALSDIREIQETVESGLASGLTSAFDGIIQGTMSVKEAFANMAISILQDLSKVIAKMMVMKLLQAAGGSFLGGLGFRDGGIASPPQARTGGIFDSGSKVQGYASGGVASGSTSGYPAILHGKEAIVPLPNGNAIPVEMRGGSTSNVAITVNMADGQGSTQTQQNNGEQGVQLGKLLAKAVQEELQKQKRPGGILSPYGAA